MIISKRMQSIQFGQLIELKHGYIMNGQYYKKDFTPMPFDFRDVQCGKNIFVTSSLFPIIRQSGDNVYSNEICTLIDDEDNENIRYLFIPSAGSIETPNLYSAHVINIKLYKIYESEDKFEILGSYDLDGSYTEGNYGTFKYMFQDKLNLYGFKSANSSYACTVKFQKIPKDTLIPAAALNDYFDELLYEDENMVISFSNPNVINEIYACKFSKNDLVDYNKVTPIKDPEDNSQYTFKNDGEGNDPNKQYANYNTIHNLFTTHTTRKAVKKFDGIFNAKDSTNLEIYRPIIGKDGILDDGKINIVKFNIDIEGMKSAGVGAMPQPTVKTCTISNKGDEKFTKWRDKMHKLNSYYFTCKTMKFQNEANTYLVIDTYISAVLSPINSAADANYVNSNIAVFKINSEDYSSLEFISEYVEPESAHKSLSVLNDDIFLLSTNTGWVFLSFDYNTGTFRKIKKIEKGTGYLGITQDDTIMIHDGTGNLDRTKMIGIPYKANIYHETGTIKWTGQEMESNLIVETKDFLGNNLDCEVLCSIIGNNVVFKDNSSTEISINITSSEDKKQVPIKITGISTVDLEAIAIPNKGV